jgi:hypothetical protein
MRHYFFFRSVWVAVWSVSFEEYYIGMHGQQNKKSNRICFKRVYKKLHILLPHNQIIITN